MSDLLPGYCGADIKALCTEAALVALRRRYPQIYGSSVKLKLDVTSIVLGPGDFSKAMRTIVPASQRALAPPGRALSPTLRPLLASSYSLVLKALLRVFPHAQCTDRDNTHGRDLEHKRPWLQLHPLFHFPDAGLWLLPPWLPCSPPLPPVSLVSVLSLMALCSISVFSFSFPHLITKVLCITQLYKVCGETLPLRMQRW